MLWHTLQNDFPELHTQYDNVPWNEASGLSCEALETECRAILKRHEGGSRLTAKAEMFAAILRKGQICVRPNDWFADGIRHADILTRIRGEWYDSVWEAGLRDAAAEAGTEPRTWSHEGNCDFGHTCPDWDVVYRLGLPGLLERIRAKRREHEAAGTLTEERAIFYNACQTVYEAAIDWVDRLADEALRQKNENEKMPLVAASLRALTRRAPQTLLEAMQLSFLYYMLHQEVEGESLRSLGNLDTLLLPFYRADLASGRLTEEQARELVGYFFTKYGAVHYTANVPFCLCGIDENGADLSNELTCLLLEEYAKLKVISPKIQVRVSSVTDESVVRLILSVIRGGSNSIVFLNDDVVIPALQKIGESWADARRYMPIGCYEPSAMGTEVACTCNGLVNMAMAVAVVMQNGVDTLTGKQCGLQFDNYPFASFEDFYAAVKAQIAQWANQVMDQVSRWETHYPEINPAPFFSAAMDDCVSNGRDAYAGGAKYNNSSINFIGTATTVDALSTVQELVYNQKAFSFAEMAEAMGSNWEGAPRMQQKCRTLGQKYGNGVSEVDALTADLSAFASGCVNRKPNGRGGVFRFGSFSIDWCFSHGSHTGATPDGRADGEPLSKNLCATVSQDKRGITALIRSVTAADYTNVPNGTVLDVMLHPSAVRGEAGLEAMLGVLKTYLKRGGLAIHFNIFDAAILRDAKKNPEKYATLQVRVCGWNAYFVDLREEEQDAFIRQAENSAGS